MANLQLKFACALYDRMQPLYTGEVQPAGIELNFIPIEQPRPIFDRMSGGQEFDVAEYSSSEFVQRFANKQCPFVAIPVFPSRASVTASSPSTRSPASRKPKDLEGKRIGVPLYTMTAAIFIRGLLQHDFGVDFAKIHLGAGRGERRRRPRQADRAAAPEARCRSSIDPNGRSLSDLIEDARGRRDPRHLAPGIVPHQPDITRLFPNYVECERDHYKRTEHLSDHASRRDQEGHLRALSVRGQQPLRCVQSSPRRSR